MSRGYRLPAEKVDRARVLRGWSVADMARESGLSIATASRALAGRPLSVETLRRLGRAFIRHPRHPELGALLDGELGGLDRAGEVTVE